MSGAFAAAWDKAFLACPGPLGEITLLFAESAGRADLHTGAAEAAHVTGLLGKSVFNLYVSVGIYGVINGVDAAQLAAGTLAAAAIDAAGHVAD